MTKEEIRALAETLDQARRRRREIDPLTLAHPALSLPEAYAVQAEGVGLRAGGGEKVVGFKMGLTSEAKMRQMGVNAPIWGVLTDAMRLDNGGAFACAGAIHPRVEPEIAFIIGRDLKGRPSPEEALKSCSGVCAALEIIDSRYRDFRFTLPDVVADDCSACAFVLGPAVRPAEADVSRLKMALEIDGQAVQEGSSEAIYGHPARSLAALCALLDEAGEFLKAGSVVLAGAATQAVALKAGSRARAVVEGLGEASVSVV